METNREKKVIRVTVKLFGTLLDQYPDYDSQKGITTEMPDGASISDLFNRLEITDADGYFASMNNRVMKGEQKLTHNATVLILQILAGG